MCLKICYPPRLSKRSEIPYSGSGFNSYSSLSHKLLFYISLPARYHRSDRAVAKEH